MSVLLAVETWELLSPEVPFRVVGASFVEDRRSGLDKIVRYKLAL